MKEHEAHTRFPGVLKDVEQTQTTKEMDSYLCIGDHISLYCEDTGGFVYSEQNSMVCNGLFVHRHQHQSQPNNITNVQTVKFQVITQNRYKLTKNYRDLVQKYRDHDKEENYEVETLLQQAKLASDAENADNTAEQKRLQGKRLRYGEIVQLSHVFSDNFIHVSTTKTSVVDRNKMMVSLQDYSSKHAQFRIMPLCKVKAEGEFIEVHDQVVIESVKAPGQFLHASLPYDIDAFTNASELNLGTERTGFTVIKNYAPSHGPESHVRGGSVIQLFHKDLEAHIVAEGIFGEPAREDVHLRLRKMDQTKPRTLYPPKNGITYWQVEAHDSVLHGSIIQWRDRIRLRHMTTRQYLAVYPNKDVHLVDKGEPFTVFRFHPVNQAPQDQKVVFDSNVRIEHALTNTWLHASHGGNHTYERTEGGGSEGSSLEALRWDGAILKKLLANDARKYHDAFSIQKVNLPDYLNVNFVAGLVPWLRNVIHSREQKEALTVREAVNLTNGFQALCEFIQPPTEKQPRKNHQKLLRHLKVADLLITFLKCSEDQVNASPELAQVCKAVYKVLLKYSLGRSRKNALYFAKYIKFFDSQLDCGGGVGLMCAQVLIALIKDNRKIVDRISSEQIDHMIGLLQNQRHYLYLELLGTLCVCQDIAITDNQNYIAEHLLSKHTAALFQIEMGQDVQQVKDVLYISVDRRNTWKELHKFIYKSNPDYDVEAHKFLKLQLELYKQLCYGRNENAIKAITRHRALLTWEVAFQGLRSEVIPDKMRAMFCDLIVVLFVDVGDDQSLLEMTCNNFVYGDINSLTDNGNSSRERDYALDTLPKNLDSDFPSLKVWLTEFLQENDHMCLSTPGRNILIQQVLRLVTCLVRYGYYGTTQDLSHIRRSLVSLVNGRNDVPFPKDRGLEYSMSARHYVEQYRKIERYVKSPETDAIVEAKIRCLELLDFLFIQMRTSRLKFLLSIFKNVDMHENSRRKKNPNPLALLLRESFNPDKKFWKSSNVKKQLNTLMKNLFVMNEFFDESFPNILLDLTNYNSDRMVVKALEILNKYFSSKPELFQMATRTQVLTSVESSRVHREVLATMTKLARLAKMKLNEELLDQMSSILMDYKLLCHVPHYPLVPHPTGQNILINAGILSIIKDFVLQEVDRKLVDQYQIMKEGISKALVLLRFLAQGNEFVQKYLIEDLDSFLRVQTCGSELALALREVFVGNLHSMQVHPRHVSRIIHLLWNYQQEAPELLQLLRALVKVEPKGIILRRNQQLVIKSLMEQYTRCCYIMNWTPEQRLKALQGELGDDHRSYLIELVDLLACCAEGDSQCIESFCSTLMGIEEVLTILVHNNIMMQFKAPFIRYFVWVYMRTGRTPVDSGADVLPHHQVVWHFLKQTLGLTRKVCTELSRVTETAELAVTTMPLSSTPNSIYKKQTSEQGPNFTIPQNLHYLQNSALIFAQTFFLRFYKPDKDLYPEEVELFRKFNTSVQALERMLAGGIVKKKVEELHRLWQGQNDKVYNGEEIELNRKLHRFVRCCIQFIEGQNTVACQLRIRGKKARQTAYVQDETTALPLGDEFQRHVKCFVNHKGKDMISKYARCYKLIQQLQISVKLYHQKAPAEQEKLDVSTLRILRAVIYNRVVQLPRDWPDNPTKYEKPLNEIRDIQGVLDHFGIVKHILPALARDNTQIQTEALALMDMLLFNAAKQVQESILRFFVSTREEVFFVFIRSQFEISAMGLKERRSIYNQKKAKEKRQQLKQEQMEKEATMEPDPGVIKRQQTLQAAADLGKRKIKRRSSLRAFLRRKVADKLLLSVTGIELEPVSNNAVTEDTDDLVYDDELDEGGFDQGNMDLVLQVLAGMCDGQHRNLQDYLRDQPDNVRSANLVEEVTRFVNVVYSSITGDTIDLLTQVIDTLNELAQGNQENRSVILNNKIVDYINFISRATEFEGCTPEQVLELRSVISHLTHSLIEESSPEAFTVAKDVADTIDVGSFRRIMTLCYTLSTDTDADLQMLVSAATQQDEKKKKGLLKRFRGTSEKNLREEAATVGFHYYRVLARLFDINTRLEKAEIPQTEKKAFKYFRENCRSIEIVKEDYLQKIHFRVHNASLLREEVKEKVKWNIDRTSPSGKLRDLLSWTKDILKDISYQETMLRNPVMAQLAKRWQVWNILCILLSLVINVVMLITWKAPMSGHDLPDPMPDNFTMPPAMYSLEPRIDWDGYTMFMQIAGGIHNFCSVMLLLSYLLLNHPRLPDVRGFFAKIAELCRKKDENEVDTSSEQPVVKAERQSKLEVKLLSQETIFYLLMSALSLAGTFLHGYFFAFHMLNIVTTNQLLTGVIQAITKNGMSLLWVAILGMIVIYIYALIGFAFFRPINIPDVETYCRTLYECSLTVFRYGLIGNIFDMAHIESERSFANFGWMTLYQVTFFIVFTTIGLNIIFGIIVDTFSELRDLKWMAEQDMRDACFICSRDSYDFEQTGQGFQHHVLNHHNMWSYIFYFIYLHDTQECDYTALDLYVYRLLKEDKLDFFPLNRALCLSQVDEDSTDSKVDDLMKAVENIQKWQREERLNRLLDHERKKYEEWEKKYKKGQLRRTVSLSDVRAPIHTQPMRVDLEAVKELDGQAPGSSEA